MQRNRWNLSDFVLKRRDVSTPADLACPRCPPRRPPDRPPPRAARGHPGGGARPRRPPRGRRSDDRSPPPPPRSSALDADVDRRSARGRAPRRPDRPPHRRAFDRRPPHDALTRAWIGRVAMALARASDAADFDAFIARSPELLTKSA